MTDNAREYALVRESKSGRRIAIGDPGGYRRREAVKAAMGSRGKVLVIGADGAEVFGKCATGYWGDDDLVKLADYLEEFTQ